MFVVLYPARRKTYVYLERKIRKTSATQKNKKPFMLEPSLWNIFVLTVTTRTLPRQLRKKHRSTKIMLRRLLCAGRRTHLHLFPYYPGLNHVWDDYTYVWRLKGQEHRRHKNKQKTNHAHIFVFGGWRGWFCGVCIQWMV